MVFGPFLSRYRHSQSGAAATEFALILPFVMVLMFGSFEMGNYFWKQHVVVKSVREGARYAARLPFGKFDCDSADIVVSATDAAVDADAIARIKLLTRTGQIANANATTRVKNWDDTEVTVTVSCPDTDFSTGLYANMPNGLRVVVSAVDVPYPSLFATLGFEGAVDVKLNASSSSAVMGL
jgi:Flp pilus assembly protein TadG